MNMRAASALTIPPRPIGTVRTKVAASVQDAHTPSQDVSTTARELWRDFGINPAAMARRAFVEKILPQGSPLPQGVKAPELVMQNLGRELQWAIESSDGLATLEKALQTVARSAGLELSIATGAPTVNWDSARPGVLDVSHTGGPAALHEMVHVVQCIIGGSAALGHAAVTKFQEAHGRQPITMHELQPYLLGLDEKDKAAAMKSVVKPMETLAYSRFEESAFQTAGMSGRKSKHFGRYKARLHLVAQSFLKAYTRSEVPELKTDIDSKLYGSVAHLARTHGETGLLMLGAGAAYYGLAKMAMRAHPAMALPMAAPLGYVLYRALVSG